MENHDLENHLSRNEPSEQEVPVMSVVERETEQESNSLDREHQPAIDGVDDRSDGQQPAIDGVDDRSDGHQPAIDGVDDRSDGHQPDQSQKDSGKLEADTLTDDDENAPNIGSGLLKIQVEDPLHRNVKVENETSGSETEIEAEDIGQVEIDTGKQSDEAPTSSLLPESWDHSTYAKYSTQSSSAGPATPPGGTGNILNSDPRQMILMLSEKISSALTSVTGDFNQDVITEKISDVLRDVIVPLGKSGAAAGAPVFPEAKSVPLTKPQEKVPPKSREKGPSKLKKRGWPKFVPKRKSKRVKVTKVMDEMVIEPAVHVPRRPERRVKKNYHCTKCDQGFSSNLLLKKHVCVFDDGPVDMTMAETGSFSGEMEGGDKGDVKGGTKGGTKSGLKKKASKVNAGQRSNAKPAAKAEKVVQKDASSDGKTFRCHCGRYYSSKASMQAHQHTRHGEMPYYCEICDHEFLKLSQLREHEREDHGNDRPFICETCGKTFAKRRYYNDHQQTHRKKKQFVCEVCGRAYSHMKHLRVHRSMHIDGGKANSCTICGKTFLYKYYLAVHQRIHAGDKPFVCTVCGKGFVVKSSLMMHERTHTGEKPYKCETCGKFFTQGSNLIIHQRMHTGERPHKCDQCGRRFTRGGDLTKHKETHMIDKPYKCTECGKGFVRDKDRIKHARKHTGEKPFICQVCGKAFTERQSVVVHERIHTDIRPYKCKQCGKAFNYSNHLTIHLRTHSGERPYKCSQCEKTFTNISNKIKHERTHTGLKPYPCQHCGKAFNARGDKIRHEQTHFRGEYKGKTARSNNAQMRSYEESGVESPKSQLTGFPDLGETGYNSNSYMYQQL